MPLRVLISDSLSKQGLQALEDDPEIEVVNKPGMDVDELKKEIATADAILIRSGTKLTRDVIEAANDLKVIGRAGAGLDNVDTPAATEKGIVVMNTPGGNTLSAAEQTMALMLALSRNLPQSVISLQGGAWDRKKFTGTELYGKTLGVIGMGNIGTAVAVRAEAFGMNAIGYDPFMTEEAMMKVGVEPVSLEDLYQRADYITLHVPVNDNTRKMINAETIGKMKNGVRIINCARGAVIDEEALLAALESGKVAGAALDVLQKEPPEDNPLVKHPKCVVTPHLGASTTEAQERVAVEIVDQVKEYLHGGPARNAANIPTVDRETYEVLKPFIQLTEKIGKLATILADSVTEVAANYQGTVTDYDVSILTISLLKGVLTPIVGNSVNFVSAPGTAEQRGIVVTETKSSVTGGYTNFIAVTLKTAEGEEVNVAGTVFPAGDDARIVRINGYHVDAHPTGWMIVLRNEDRPGTMGAIGTVLGEAGVNISDMTLGRREKGEPAVTVYNVESEVPDEVMNKIRAMPNVVEAKLVNLG